MGTETLLENEEENTFSDEPQMPLPSEYSPGLLATLRELETPIADQDSAEGVGVFWSAPPPPKFNEDNERSNDESKRS